LRVSTEDAEASDALAPRAAIAAAAIAMRGRFMLAAACRWRVRECWRSGRLRDLAAAQPAPDFSETGRHRERFQTVGLATAIEDRGNTAVNQQVERLAHLAERPCDPDGGAGRAFARGFALVALVEEEKHGEQGSARQQDFEQQVRADPLQQTGCVP
jgi:hypothetical protein